MRDSAAMTEVEAGVGQDGSATGTADASGPKQSGIFGQRAPDEVDAVCAQLEAGEPARALALATEIVRLQPHNMLAIRLAAQARKLLEERYVASLGSASNVPHLVQRLELDEVARHVVALVDGARSVAAIADASAYPRVVTLRVLCDLQGFGVVELRPPR